MQDIFDYVAEHLADGYAIEVALEQGSACCTLFEPSGAEAAAGDYISGDVAGELVYLVAESRELEQLPPAPAWEASRG